MALSISDREIVLIPVKDSSMRIEVNNMNGKISFRLWSLEVSLIQLDKIIEDLKLAKQISEEIKSTKV